MQINVTKENIETYFKNIEKIYKTGVAVEATYRPAFVSMIDGIDKNLQAFNEQKQIKCGSPDIIVLKNKLSVGYIELKDIGVNLDKVEASEQLKKYFKQLDNLILSDYLDFRLYVKGELKQSVKIGEVKNNKIVLDKVKINDLTELLNYFLNKQVEQINNSQALAFKLARLAKGIREIVLTEINNGTTTHLIQDIRNNITKISNDKTPETFADVYAQTVTYSLFMARCNHIGNEEFSRFNAISDIPKTVTLIKDLFGYAFCDNVVHETFYYLIEDIITILANTNIDKIKKEYYKEGNKANLIINFYEPFLKEFDSETKQDRGVFYTPTQVVNFMVRATDNIVKTKFNTKNGLANIDIIEHSVITECATDENKNKKNKNSKIITKTRKTPRVIILDPAGGTGGYLNGVIEHIKKDTGIDEKSGMWGEYVNNYLIPKLQMFEVMIAPYTMAHLNLQMAVMGENKNMIIEKPFNICLTNTLENKETEKQDSCLFTCIKDEIIKANDIKKRLPVSVIIGNPPYNARSQNTYDVNAYKFINGESINEKTLNSIQDDYVKFIRWSQKRVENEKNAVVAFITNNGFIDNVTFRGMRKSLMETFDEIYILDLHGNSTKKEMCPDGSKDENVFNIKQGVSINIFIKKAHKQKETIIKHAECYGTQEYKLKFLNDNEFNTIAWSDIKPEAPNYMFKTINNDANEYNNYFSMIDEIFINKFSGAMSGNDDLLMTIKKENIIKLVNEIITLPYEECKEKYGREKSASGRGWSIENAKKDIIDTQKQERNFVEIAYRAFDKRYTYFTGNSNGFHSMPNKGMCNIANKENISIITVRRTVENKFNHTFIAKTIIDYNFCSGSTATFPLYTYNGDKKESNINPEFIKKIESILKIKLGKNFTEEMIINYIYAIINSPMYRARYINYLKYDYPKIPIVKNVNKFMYLCKIGEELTKTHLMENNTLSIDVKYPIKGDNKVTKVKHNDDKLYINETQYFNNISIDVYNAVFGGNQVVKKWFDARKGLTLDYDDMKHINTMVNAISRTFEIQTEIDNIIGSFPEAV
jgi:uracil phosphoribosyltransferase